MKDKDEINRKLPSTNTDIYKIKYARICLLCETQSGDLNVVFKEMLFIHK